MKTRNFSSEYQMRLFQNSAVLVALDYQNKRHVDPLLKDTTFCSIIVTKEPRQEQPYTIWIIYETEKHSRHDVMYANASTQSFFNNFSFKDSYKSVYDFMADLVTMTNCRKFQIPNNDKIFDFNVSDKNKINQDFAILSNILKTI